MAKREQTKIAEEDDDMDEFEELEDEDENEAEGVVEGKEAEAKKQE